MTLQDSSTTLRAYFFLTVTALCWGGNAVFGRWAVGEISPMALVSARWCGVLILLALFARTRILRDWPVLRTRLGFIFAMGALGFAAFNGLFYVSAHWTTAVNIGIIQGSIPVFVIIGAFLTHGNRITPLQAVGIGVTVLGVITVASGGSLRTLAGLALNTGDILMVIACALYAGYAVGLLRRPKGSALSLFAMLSAAAFVTSLPMLGAEIFLGRFQWPTATGWIIVGLVILLPSFLAQIFFMRGVELIGPGRAGVFINLVPVFASLFAVVFLKEPFAMFQAAALGMVLGGIWLSEKGKST